MLSDISKREKDRQCMNSLIYEIKKKKKNRKKPHRKREQNGSFLGV